MHSPRWRPLVGALGLIGVLALLPTLVTWAQQTARIYLLQLDTKEFPQYIIDIRLTDDTGRPVVALNESDLAVYENDRPLDFQLEKVEGGIDLFLVFDAGAGIRYGTPPRYEKMRRIANELLSHLSPKDRVGIIIVYATGAELVQALTAEHTLVSNYLANWSPPSTRNLSPGLEGLRLALEQFNVEQSARPRAIVFFTRGVQRFLGTPETDANQLASLAYQQQTPVYVYNFHDTGKPVGYQEIVTASGGQIFNVAHREAETAPLLQDLHLWRTVFRIYARSQSPAPKRTVRVQLAQRPEVSVAQEVSLVPPPANPKVNFVVNNGSEQIVFALDEKGKYTSPDIPISVEISWPDGYERQVREVALFVNGQLFGAPKTNPPLDKPITFIWHPNPELASPVRFEIRVVDELGLRSEVAKDIPLIFEETAAVVGGDIMCRSLRKIPSVGGTLHKWICLNLGLTLGNVIVLIGVIIVGVIAVRRREQVVELARSTVDNVTQIVARVTKTLQFGKRKPKARLHIVDGRGEDAALPETIDIFGETKLGRDPKYVDIVLNRPAISRLHCEIHEDLTLGRWTIEDKESSNGTYLNGERLKPHQPYPLKDGDIIDIAPLYRGGVRLRFEVLEEASAMPDVTVSETDFLTSEVEKTLPLSDTGDDVYASSSDDLAYDVADLDEWAAPNAVTDEHPPSDDGFDDLSAEQDEFDDPSRQVF